MGVTKEQGIFYQLDPLRVIVMANLIVKVLEMVILKVFKNELNVVQEKVLME